MAKIIKLGYLTYTLPTRINIDPKYYRQNLTFKNRCIQSVKAAQGYLFATLEVSFQPYFFAIVAKCRRLYGVRPMRFKRKAVTFTP